MSQAKRVCVIGAGPSGMSVLYQFNQLKAHGKEIPEIVCYDKQSDWGGLWKYSWETGKEYCVLRLLIKHTLKFFIRTHCCKSFAGAYSRVAVMRPVKSSCKCISCLLLLSRV